MKTPHTSCKRGKRVIVTLRNGQRFVDKFIEHRSQAIVLETHGVVPTITIRAFSIYRGQSGY